ncbi:VCBS repeat-containing protein [Candidatus Dependentiae bacterium]|nr:VCBS repeat-containing protein [Candidatus Dependentiae bacterium]
MKKIIILAFILSLFSSVYGYDYEIIDKNKNIYYYCFMKAVSFNEQTKTKFAWVEKYKKYFESGIQAASGENFEQDAITKQIDVDYYFRHLSNYYYNIPLPDENNMRILKDNTSLRYYMEIIDKEIDKASSVIKNGNPEAGAFFLGAMTKYFCSLALWPYCMGKNSAFGTAKNEVIKEFFSELDAFVSSENLFKLDNRIKFDGFKNKFDAEEAVVNIVKFSALDFYNPETYKRMNAIAMYNLIPMSDPLNKKVVISKNLSSLSGLNVSYTDWQDNFVNQIAGTLEYCLNFLYEAVDLMPNLDSRKPAEIINLKFEPYDKRIRLFWDLSVNRKIDRQLVYQKNNRTGSWEFIGTAGNQMQSYVVENLVNGSRYMFKVTVQEPLRPESEGKEIEALAIDNVPPSKPPKMIVEPLNTCIRIRLSKKQNDYDLKGYILYIYNDKNEFIRNVELQKNFNSYIIENLTNGIRYKIALSAYDESLNESEEYDIAYAVPADLESPGPVSNLTAAGINNRITASWSPSPDLNGDLEFQLLVLYDKENKKLKEFKLAPGVNVYTISDVLNDYEYKIGIKCADEVPNLSQEIFVKVTPKFSGKIFSQNSLPIIDNIIPFVCQADIDGSGTTDIVTVQNNKIVILYNNNLKFEVVETGILLDDTENFIKPYIADFDNDGKKDLIILQNGILKSFRGFGYNKFENMGTRFQLSVKSEIKDLQVLNINNDNYPDLLILMKDDKLFIFENTGNMIFANANAELGIAMTDVFDYIKICDFNNDGFSDILCRTNFVSNNNLMFFENKSGKSFVRKNLINNVELKISNAEFSDFNNDGKTDLFLTFNGISINGQIYNNLIFWNTGENLALRESKSQLDIPDDVSVLSTGDYDSDGDKDLFITCKNKKLFLYKNSGFEFASDKVENEILNTNSIIYQSFFIDYNNDGDYDFINVYDNKIIIFENNINSVKKIR